MTVCISSFCCFFCLSCNMFDLHLWVYEFGSVGTKHMLWVFISSAVLLLSSLPCVM
ncbi:hypothetical protein BDW42DRAFT_158899 [Aspergillus taichungensis]|uniref:Uncharacterized protein n=1 Tax=Aspergillus taichungensis TaxID=482145 RepID=A0A2J5I8Q5_9EURO|nr:hypothetical protein BDW42DRAFT_158899 [Aspergillus taichungensis]